MALVSDQSTATKARNDIRAKTAKANTHRTPNLGLIIRASSTQMTPDLKRINSRQIAYRAANKRGANVNFIVKEDYKEYLQTEKMIESPAKLPAAYKAIGIVAPLFVLVGAVQLLLALLSDYSPSPEMTYGLISLGLFLMAGVSIKAKEISGERNASVSN